MKSSGLYIHIPFCTKKCPYCDFYSIANLSKIHDFLCAIKKEIFIYSKKNEFTPFDTIYFGGGTPSLLSADLLSDLIEFIFKHMKFSCQDKDIEITLEANPQDISKEYLSSIKQAGINRLNIGVQSFNDEILKFLGRLHTAKKAKDTLRDAYKIGFDNIGIDLIYSLYGQSISKWEEDLKEAIFHLPEHISCYQLTIHKNTLFGLHKKKGKLAEQDDDMQYKFFIKTIEMLDSASYHHYEISNFAKELSKRSCHNQKYWYHFPYLGIGPSAHSFLPQNNNSKPKRWWNHSSLSKYINDLSLDLLPTAAHEYLEKDELKLEALYLGLRTKDGINLDLFYEEYGQDLRVDAKDTISMLENKKFATICNNNLCLTKRGLALCDNIATLF